MTNQAQLPEGYIPHIAVKFRNDVMFLDDVKFLYEDGAEKYLEGADAEVWQQLSAKHSGLSLALLAVQAAGGGTQLLLGHEIGVLQYRDILGGDEQSAPVTRSSNEPLIGVPG